MAIRTFKNMTGLNSGLLNSDLVYMHRGYDIDRDKKITLQNLVKRAKHITTLSNWTNRIASASFFWESVKWNDTGKVFVAVASAGVGNRVMTSPDGIVWTGTASADDSNSWISLAYSPTLNLYVAVANAGASNRVMTANQSGVGWTLRAPSAVAAWVKVIWGNNEFFAVGGTSAMQSSNGTAWNARTIGATVNDIVWSAELNLYVAVTTGANVYVSSDGITWSPHAANVTDLKRIAWSSKLNMFIALQSGFGTNYSYSYDGITWVAKALPVAGQIWTAAYWCADHEVFLIMLGSASIANCLYYSYDGLTWHFINMASADNWLDIEWSKYLGCYVAVSNTGSARACTSMFSYME